MIDVAVCWALLVGRAVVVSMPCGRERVSWEDILGEIIG